MSGSRKKRTRSSSPPNPKQETTRAMPLDLMSNVALYLPASWDPMEYKSWNSGGKLFLAAIINSPGMRESAAKLPTVPDARAT